MWLQHLRHHPLKGGRRIRQPEWHDVELEEAKLCDECRLEFVLFGDWHLVIPFRQVQRRETLRTTKVCNELVDLRNRVRVLDGDFVELSVVDADPDLVCLLANQDCWRCKRRFGLADDVAFEQLVQCVLKLLAHWLGRVADVLLERLRSFHQLDRVLVRRDMSEWRFWIGDDVRVAFAYLCDQ